MAKKDPAEYTVEEKLKTLYELQTILSQIDNQNIQSGKKSGKSSKTIISSDMDLLAYTANTVMQDEIISELKEINVQELTPIEALNVLYRLHQKAEKRI